MTRPVFIFILFILAVSAKAQQPEYLELVKAEAELEGLFRQLYTDTLSDVEPVLNSILSIMPEALSSNGALDFPWSRLNRIGVIPSDDGKVRIFTWHVMDDLDHYRYFGYIQVAMKKGNVRLYTLVDNDKDQRNLKKLDQTTDDWYGKLYYKILTQEHKRKTYYALLGMDFNNTRSTLKTVEAITIQRNQPFFEKELFFDGKDRIDRIVLEYSSQVAISVRFDPEVEMITFDHLVPFHPIYKSNYEFYGPDGSFDGLEYKDGTWIYREDIDARNVN